MCWIGTHNGTGYRDTGEKVGEDGSRVYLATKSYWIGDVLLGRLAEGMFEDVSV